MFVREVQKGQRCSNEAKNQRCAEGTGSLKVSFTKR